MNLWSLFSGGHYTTVATFGGDSSLAAAGPLFFLQGAGPFRSSRFIAAFGRETFLAAAGFLCPYGASLGILPHVAYKAGVNNGGPRGAISIPQNLLTK
jgi:hypothetical protein